MRLSIVLSIQGPLLTRSSSMGAPGTDAVAARGTDGTLSIPFSLIKGRLRDSWSQLNRIRPGWTDITDLLGSESVQSNRPARGRLTLSDFRLRRKGGRHEPAGTRVRVRIDAERGAADEAALQVLETPFAPQQVYAFEGEIYCHADKPDASREIRQRVEAGLRWMRGMGGLRSIGFGVLTDVEVRDVSAPATSRNKARGSQLTIAGDRFALRLTPRAPFCIARYGPAENLFESDEVISGGVLKGILASELNARLGRSLETEIDESTVPPRWKSLARDFHRVRITHLFPASRNAGSRRPVAAPLSLVRDDDGHLFDAAGTSEVVLRADKMGVPRAVTFDIDWKDNSDVREHFRWPNLMRELRVRTAIDPDRRRAFDQKLFALESTVPDGKVWLGWVDLSQVNGDREAVADGMADLLNIDETGHGSIGRLGKTKVQAQIQICSASDLDPCYRIDRCDVWPAIVTLQTPTLLCDPDSLSGLKGRAQDAMHAGFQRVWGELSGGALILSHYYSRQTMTGGYLHYRFQESRPYEPFLVTNAGSVFVLNAAPNQEAQATELLERWVSQGLPLPEWAIQRYGREWKTNPYVPESGFGEVAVNIEHGISPCGTE